MNKLAQAMIEYFEMPHILMYKKITKSFDKNFLRMT